MKVYSRMPTVSYDLSGEVPGRKLEANEVFHFPGVRPVGKTRICRNADGEWEWPNGDEFVSVPPKGLNITVRPDERFAVADLKVGGGPAWYSVTEYQVVSPMISEKETGGDSMFAGFEKFCGFYE